MAIGKKRAFLRYSLLSIITLVVVSPLILNYYSFFDKNDSSLSLSHRNNRVSSSEQRLHDKWLKVKDRNLFVYGAYLDSRQFVKKETASILVLGAISGRENRTIYCNVLYESKGHQKDGDDVMELVPLTVEILPYQNGLIGANAAVQVLLRCHISRQRVPIAVKLTADNATFNGTNHFPSGQDNTWLRIHQPNATPIEMCWCIPPLFRNYSNTELLIEQLEWSKLQGYGKVFIYAYQVNDAVNTVLRFYEQQGIVEIIPWMIPGLADVHYYGQKLAINDCIYRNLRHTRFLVTHDIDERLVDPNGGSVIIEIRKNFDEHRDACAFNLRQVQYYLNTDEGGILNHQVRPYIANRTKCSKVVVIPERIDVLWVHSVHRAMEGFRTFSTTNKYTVFMAHFRKYPIKSYIDDDTLNRVNRPLKERVKLVRKEIYHLK